MAKKGSLLKTVIGLGSLAVAGKVAYDKYRNTKEKYVKEEKESADDVVKSIMQLQSLRSSRYRMRSSRDVRLRLLHQRLFLT